MQITVKNAKKNLKKSKSPFIELFKNGSLSVEIYKPEKIDMQTRHDRDEVYLVMQGSGKFFCDGKTTDFKKGDFLFVPAFVEHRFLDFTDDFATWVLFYGPVGGEMGDKNVEIVSWRPKFTPAFFALNKQWIEVDYLLEPLDIEVLSNPDKYILEGGGVILAALLGEEVIGVVALRPMANGDFELTKMAVNPKHRGKKIGEKLMHSILFTAERMGLKEVILYSNSNTSAAAVQLYRKVGWVEIPLESGVYKRANIKMKYSFTH